MATLRFRQTREISFTDFVGEFPFLRSLKDKEYLVDDNFEEYLIDDIYKIINFSTIVYDDGKVSLCSHVKKTESFPIIDIGNGEFAIIESREESDDSCVKDGEKLTIGEKPDYFNSLIRVRFGIFVREKIFCREIEYI